MFIDKDDDDDEKWELIEDDTSLYVTIMIIFLEMSMSEIFKSLKCEYLYKKRKIIIYH